MNNLVLNNIKVENTIISYDYSFSDLWTEFLNKNELMYVKYQFKLDDIPKSILVIPFLCNLLPISWIFDLDIEVNELDSDFYNSIPNILAGFQKMYPNITFHNNLKVKKIIKNEFPCEKSAVLFSGGVDAYNTLLQNIDLDPMLITICGADIDVYNSEAWKIVKEKNMEVGKEFGLENQFVASNFRNCINYKNIMKYLKKITNNEWWHDFQHGPILLGLTAPLAYKYNLKNIIIASSFTKEDWGHYTCASDPIIDNEFRFASARVIHDGYEFSRTEKIRNICNYHIKNEDKKINLRVCWQSVLGDNCCECEKCYRTILAIISQKDDPRKYGFNLTSDKYNKMFKKYKSMMKYSFNRYNQIQKAFIENYSDCELPRGLEEIKLIKIKRNTPKYIVFKNKAAGKISKIFNLLEKK